MASPTLSSKRAPSRAPSPFPPAVPSSFSPTLASFSTTAQQPFFLAYDFLQQCYETVFALRPPAPAIKLPQSGAGPRIAIIGAGLTGVSVAAHCVGNGVECVLFEAGSRDSLGGIWTKPSEHASVELESLLYRFYPPTNRSHHNSYSSRQQILSYVTSLWSRYGLEQRSRFDTKVTNVYPDRLGRWIVNEPSFGRFDAVVAACGVCGDPRISIPTLRDRTPFGLEFDGPIWHSSQLNQKSAKGRKVLIVGDGPEAVGALEFAAATGALEVVVLSSEDSWEIPRSGVAGQVLAMANLIGLDRVLKYCPNSLTRLVHLPRVLSPDGKSLIGQGKPLSSRLGVMIESGKVTWLQGDIVRFLSKAVLFNRRSIQSQPGSVGLEERISGSICILATGYHRPSLSFLRPDNPDKIYASKSRAPFSDPSSTWFLQSFPTGKLDIAALNCTYMNPVGALGEWHVALYTRMLLMFVLVPDSRPAEAELKRLVERSARWRGMAIFQTLFDVLSYLELVRWLVMCVLMSSPNGWRWVLFVLFGVNKAPLSTALTCNPATALVHSIPKEVGIPQSCAIPAHDSGHSRSLTSCPSPTTMSAAPVPSSRSATPENSDTPIFAPSQSVGANSRPASMISLTSECVSSSSSSVSYDHLPIFSQSVGSAGLVGTRGSLGDGYTRKPSVSSLDRANRQLALLKTKDVLGRPPKPSAISKPQRMSDSSLPATKGKLVKTKRLARPNSMG